MNKTSLHRRIFQAAALAVTIVTILSMGIASFAIRGIGERAFEERLRQTANSLLASLSRNSDGTLSLEDNIADQPEFSRPRSGWYWQVEQNSIAVLRSRSLGAEAFPVVSPTGQGASLNGENLIIIASTERSADAFRVTVAGPRTLLNSSVLRELTPIGWVLAALLLILIVALHWALRRALAPLDHLTHSIRSLEAGNPMSLPTTGIREIDQTAEAMNGLLAEARDLVAKNRDAAAKLAHALKTPLAQMAAYGGRADSQTAGEINAAVASMRRQIDRNLHRLSQVSADKRGRSDWSKVRLVVDDLIFAFGQRESGRGITAEIQCEKDTLIPVESADLMELLGNLLDNAYRHAVHQVSVYIQTHPTEQIIVVCDDGAGFSKQQLEETGAPTKSKTDLTRIGLGLLLAKDIMRMTGGTLVLKNAPRGGAIVTCRWQQSVAMQTQSI